MASTKSTTLRFGEFTLTLRPASLSKDGRVVALQPQPLRLLTLLASRQGEIVSQEEIRRHVWGDLQVDFASGIHVCIRQIRRALGDDGVSPRFIETVPRRGYRFVADVVEEKATGRVPVWKARPYAAAAGAGLAVVLIAAAGTLLAPADNGPFAGRPDHTASTEDGYLRGVELLASGNERDAVASRRYFALAIERDGDFAPAFAGMAKAYEATRDYEQARRFAERAIAIDGTYAQAYARLAAAVSHGDWNWAMAERQLKKAISLSPGQAALHRALAANYMVTGRTGTALDEMRIALGLDPRSAALLADYGTYLYYSRDAAAARNKCDAAATLDADDVTARDCLYKVARIEQRYEDAMQHAASIMALQNATQRDMARVRSMPAESGLEAFEAWRLGQLEQRAESETVSPVSFAWSLAALRRYDEALYYLIQGCEKHFPATSQALLDPVFVPLRHQTRFIELARDMRVEI